MEGRDLRCPVQAGEEVEELLPVLPVFREGIGEGHVPHLPPRIPRAVGRKEGKQVIWVVLVLHKVKEDPLRDAQVLAVLGEEHCDGSLPGAELSGKGLVQALEDAPYPGGRDVLRADPEGHEVQDPVRGLFGEHNLCVLPCDLQIRGTGHSSRKIPESLCRKESEGLSFPLLGAKPRSKRAL